MNIKRFIFAVIALFIFIFCYETLVHGFLLKRLYQETAGIWRNYEEMMSLLPFNILVQLLVAIWLTFIFTRFYKDGGWKNGLRFGLYLGVFSAIQAAASFYYLPVPAQLAEIWFVAYLIECVVGGYIIGRIYHRK